MYLSSKSKMASMQQSQLDTQGRQISAQQSLHNSRAQDTHAPAPAAATGAAQLAWQHQLA
jgi:hypothetical protein